MLYCLSVIPEISRKNVHSMPKHLSESFLPQVYHPKIISLKIFVTLKYQNYLQLANKK